MNPILKLCQAITDGENAEELFEKLSINLTQEEKKLDGKKLMKAAMSKWLPAADTLLEMMILHLPSPVQAQKYRTEYLYEGPIESEIAKSMINCDPKGPLVIYISKMVSNHQGRFYAFGRVFSGTVSPGQKVRIMGANFVPGNKNDYYEKAIQRVAIPMGRTF